MPPTPDQKDAAKGVVGLADTAANGSKADMALAKAASVMPTPDWSVVRGHLVTALEKSRASTGEISAAITRVDAAIAAS